MTQRVHAPSAHPAISLSNEQILVVANPQQKDAWRVRVTFQSNALTFCLLGNSPLLPTGPQGRSFAKAGYALESEPESESESERQPMPVRGAQEIHVPLGVPLKCEPCEVPKPWGKEIWFSGFEARGVCQVGGVPLPWLLAAGREALFGEGVQELVLLKILDPFPEPVRGDLYTEVHAEKNEVYVCTKAPKEGGWLRFGIAPAAWDEAGRDAGTYKARYLAAVKDYEAVRRRLDARMDAHPGRALGTLATPEELAEEERLRARMNAFTALHPMHKGSVARVPVGVPHALQAGCQVVEFQTATYERAIVSFAQKVLTQNHWDTEKALALLDVEEALRSPLVPETGAGEERIVDFPAFEAWRLRMSPGETRSVGNAHTYELLYVVERDEAPADGLTEGAWLLPRGTCVTLQGAGLVLRAFPKVSHS